MVLTDGKGNGYVLAIDEEGNTIAEAVDGSGVVQDADGNTSLRLGMPRTTDGEGNFLAADEKRSTIVEATDGSGVVLDSNGNIILVGDAELRRATWC